MTISYRTDVDLALPDSDGQSMADNTEQFSWIVLIKENLEIIFAENPHVFIAGDLLWYPVKSRFSPRMAPDAMVVFGRPKGKRGSYRQWKEENVPPQVVFEILSPSNTPAEMDRKLEFYETYGVEEYYLYDPSTNQFDGWERQAGMLNPIAVLNQWVSPRLGIRFDLSGLQLVIYRPDGQRFLSPIELDAQIQQARNQAELAQQRATTAETQLQSQQQQLDAMAAKLRELGVDPDRL
jgi:Uma2 family endonuclease